MKQCTTEGCESPHAARGLCQAHYRKWRRLPEATNARVNVDQRRCSIEDCDGAHQAQGYCQKHYTRLKKYGDPLATKYNIDGPAQICTIDGCPAETKGKGLCSKHYQRQAKGQPLIREREGGGWVNCAGYIFRQINGRAVAEHRLVIEELLDRELLPHETVHHRNGDRQDNRASNLELWSSSHPRGQRVADKLAWAREIIALYGPARKTLEALGEDLHR